jgi:hypothetical protein
MTHHITNCIQKVAKCDGKQWTTKQLNCGTTRMAGRRAWACKHCHCARTLTIMDWLGRYVRQDIWTYCESVDGPQSWSAGDNCIIIIKTDLLLGVLRASYTQIILLCYIQNIFTLRSIFCRVCATSVNILSSSSLHCHYTFRPIRTSSGIQVVLMKDSGAHCDAVLLFICNCLGLILGYVA